MKDGKMKLKANWIWKKQKNYNQYNQTIVASKSLELNSAKKAVVAVTADSNYRLLINGQWVCDGPCRSYPEHYCYDEMDVVGYLRDGRNEIQIIANYLGIGSPHHVPKQAGVLFQMEAESFDGEMKTIISDETWLVAEAKAWQRKVFRRPLPTESYDGRLEDSYSFKKAAVLFATNEGPWKDLQPRNVALMTKNPRGLRNFMTANVVKKDFLDFHFPVSRLIYPGLIEQNWNTSVACAIATVIRASRAKTIAVNLREFRVTLNGKKVTGDNLRLKAGDNFLLGLADPFLGYWCKDLSVHFFDTNGFELVNPIDSADDNPWCFAPLKEGRLAENDIIFVNSPYPPRDNVVSEVTERYERVEKEVDSAKAFEHEFGAEAVRLSCEEMFVTEPSRHFFFREVLDDALSNVHEPGALMHDNDQWTEVRPSSKGDVELVYDFGEQIYGYYTLEVFGGEGLTVDVNAIEHIWDGERIQKTGHSGHELPHPNGFRYVCKQGMNRFTSLKRRSGRYLFITLRNQNKNVSIRKIGIIESLYPVVESGSFTCSDPVLDDIWQICARTLKICMLDTYVDCPLYEQTFWVGDARNEALYGYTAFGASDIARRGLMIGEQSLEHLPLVGCQIPSCWHVILPAWSFMWHLAIWDYYYYSGDKAYLRKSWKNVKRNLKNATKYIDERGLFSPPFWNMFDWAAIDSDHNCVLHNNMFFVGAIDAAIKSGRVLNDAKTATWLRNIRKGLVKAINTLWDKKKGSYPDSIHNDGTISKSHSQHRSAKIPKLWLPQLGALVCNSYKYHR